MKLSEAILLGSTIAKPLSNATWGTCLCGVACAAFGSTNANNREAEARWPWLREIKFKMFNRDGSMGNDPSYPGRMVVTGLCSYVVNGSMTLERAVDLIRQIEPQDTPQEQVCEGEAERVKEVCDAV